MKDIQNTHDELADVREEMELRLQKIAELKTSVMGEFNDTMNDVESWLKERQKKIRGIGSFLRSQPKAIEDATIIDGDKE